MIRMYYLLNGITLFNVKITALKRRVTLTVSVLCPALNSSPGQKLQVLAQFWLMKPIILVHCAFQKWHLQYNGAILVSFITLRISFRTWNLYRGTPL